MAADEPPYLTVGTDVSAKYKGAFCEAKIKKVNRVVKCKVTFKNNMGSAMIPDEQIRGNLRIGAEIEARHPEKNQFLEAVINKMQDYSQYTVVFDDGDETTLRRTSLCLKSGRHFAESPTLDQFPLTNPEHFGTPVIGSSKTKRKRRSTMNSAVLDYYSSDEELIPKKTKLSRVKERDPDVGKVVCVDYGDRRKKDNWYPGLVVPNSAQVGVQVSTKEEYLIRSFKDGKYYQVPKKDTREFTREISRKVDNHTLRIAVDKAMLYFEKGELPPHWDKTLYLGLNIAMNEEDSHDTDSDSSDDEPSEEKDRFVAQLYKFMDERGTPINKAPSVASRDLNLYKLFKVVHKMGGYNRVTNQNKWKIVYSKMGFPLSNPSGSNQIKLAYKRYLHSFEDFYRKLGCTMVTNSRSIRGRHRSDRNFIITRNRDRDTASPKRKKEVKDKSCEKKVEEKSKVSNEKKETKVKSEPNVKNEEKQKSPDKKKSEKTKNDDKEEKVKPKKEDNKPRLVRSQSLNKDKKDKEITDEKKETRMDRAKAREDAKREKTVSPEKPEKKKETRSSAKFEQARERRERESSDKKLDNDVKEQIKKDEKPSRQIKEEKSSDKKEESPRCKKIEKTLRDKEEKQKNSSDSISVKDKKEVKKEKNNEVSVKEKKVEAQKVEKVEDAVSIKDKKDKQKEVKVNKFSPDREEKVAKDKISVECETGKDSSSKEKIPKEAENDKEEGLIKNLDEIKEEKVPDGTDAEKDSFEVVSVSGPSGNDEDEFTPGKITKKRRTTTEDKEDVKLVMDLFEDSDDELHGSSSEKSENKDGKAKSIEVGDKVKVKYGRGRTQKVYEAKVLKIEMDAGEKRYYVHYAGWNTRYDEWVRRNFIVENISEHNRSMRRKKQELNAKNNSPPSPSKKNDRVKPPGAPTTSKLHRKNSTSSTNSSTVSNSRTTRSDKSGLQTSPFCKGLQPRKRAHKKAGKSWALTDTSQDSESDEDDSMLMDPDDEEEDEDIDVEGMNMRKAKEEMFSDDDEIEFETFRKLPEKELSLIDAEEKPALTVGKAEEETPETCDAIESKLKNLENAAEKKSSVNESKIDIQIEEKIIENKPVQSTPDTVQKSSLPTNNDSNLPIKPSKPEEISQVDVPVLKKVEEVMIEKPKSISELIEKKYVEPAETQPEKKVVDSTPIKTSDEPKKIHEEKFPPPMIFMGSYNKLSSLDVSAKSKVESSYSSVSQSSSSCLPKVQTNKEVTEESSVKSMFEPLLSSNKSLGIAQNTTSKTGIKSESPLASTPNKGSYVPMFLFNTCNPKLSPLSCDKFSSNIKNPVPEKPVQSLPKLLPPDKKEQTEIKPAPIESKPILPFKDILRDQIACKECLTEDKSSFTPITKTTIVTTSSQSTNVASTVKSAGEKKNYDSVIHNISNLFKRETEAKGLDIKTKIPFPVQESKVHRPSYDFPLTAASKSKSAEDNSQSLQMGKFFRSLSSIKKIEPSVSFESPISKDKVLEVKSSTKCEKSAEVSAHRYAPFLKKDTMSDFDALKNSSFPKKDIVSTPVKVTETKEASTHTSVIAFASSTSTGVVPSLPSEEVKKVEEKKDFVPLICSSNIKKDNKQDPVTEDIVKTETLNSETSVEPCNLSSKPKNIETDKKSSSSEVPKKDVDYGESIHKSLIELSIEEKGKESPCKEQNLPANNSNTDDNICNVFLNVSADKKDSKDIKELFTPVRDPDETLKTKDDRNVSIASSCISAVLPSEVTENIGHSASGETLENVSTVLESEGSGSPLLHKKDVKKKKSKASKKLSMFEAMDKEDKSKEGKIKSKKKAKFDSEDATKSKDTELKTKSKKFKKNKNKKRFSKSEDRGGDSSVKGDNNESGLRDIFSEKLKKKKERKREEKKFSKAEAKFDEMADSSKSEFSKKDRKKSKKNREKLGSDKKGDLGEKKIKKKKKIVHTEDNLDSDSEKDSIAKLSDKKKKKDKKKVKPKDSSSSDDAADNRLLIDEGQSSFVPVQEVTEKREKADDPDMSFLLCEEKVPASPVGVNSLPEDTTGSSSLDDSNNRSPSSDEDRIQSVNLDVYPRAANMGVLDAINKRNAEACAVLDNTPPTTPSSSPASIPSSSPSHDREPFLHYTESTQSGRESCEGESDSFHCVLNRAEMAESEEYRAAATLAFAVCKSSVGEKPPPESPRASIKKQKCDFEDYSPSKRRKKNKRSFGVAEVTKIGNTRYKAAARSPRGESCDTYDSSNASILTAGSPPHGSASTPFTSFSHHSSSQISAPSDTSTPSSMKPSKLNLNVPLHEYKDPEKRIAVLQEKMSELRKLYASLKAEVATIDRRRKKARKKNKEAAASTPANNTSVHEDDLQHCS